MNETLNEEALAIKIAFHEQKSHEFTQAGKHATSVAMLLDYLRNANLHSKEVARLVAKMNGWGETSINHL